MEDYNLEKFKLSALSKSKEINQYVTNITIGPNRNCYEGGKQHVILKNTGVQTTLAPELIEKPNFTIIITNEVHSIYEQKRQKNVQSILRVRTNNIHQTLKEKQVDLYKDFQAKQKLKLKERYQQDLLILREVEKDNDTPTHDQLQYLEELAERKKRIDKDVKEYERCKIINNIILKIQANQTEFNQIYQDCLSTLESCKYRSELKKVLGNIPNELQRLPDNMQEIVGKCTNRTVTENDTIVCAQLVNSIKALLETLKQKTLEVTEKQEKEKEVPVKPKSVIKRSIDIVTTISDIKSTQIDKFISKTSLRTYSELQQFLDNFERSYDDLLNDARMKNFRFDCKKAINIPVNAISAVNSQHLLDKYVKLSNLLQGKTVEVGEIYVCAGQHPQGVAFCLYLLAKKFVLQGDLMISSKPEAAFCYAAIITALWYDNENFGKLLLAHLHKQCPYLVPLYPPRSVEQDDKEYYMSLGYQYTDNVVEKQDKFLKRMTGIMRLYAAIIITKPKKGHQRNLHGIQEGWRWLTSFLNLEPKPDITATLLHIFFEMTGSTMQVIYGKVFTKLMKFVCQAYLPMIQKIDTGGPVTRLEVLLQDYLKTGRFDEPLGLFPPNFW